MSRRGLRIVAPLALLVTLSCQLILGLEEPVGHRPAPADAGKSRDPCAHAVAPAPPTKDDDPSGGAQHDYWIAVESVFFPAIFPQRGPFRGLDLDNSCTCQRDLWDGGAPCASPGAPTTACDEDGGVDDSLGSLVRTYQGLTPNLDLADRVNVQIRNGLHTFILYVSAYNGQANDQEVSATIVASGGLYTNVGCDGVARDAGPPLPSPPDASPPGPRYAPIWDGCDRWTPEEGQVSGGYPNRKATATLSAAYVVDHTLVIQFDAVGLAVFGGTVTFHAATAMFKLAPEGKSFRADGIIAGRASFAELIAILARTSSEVGDDVPTVPLCETSGWGVVAPVSCSAQDTMLAPNQDHTGQVCDAMTGVLGLTGRPIEIADGEYNHTIQGEDCPDATVVCGSR